VQNFGAGRPWALRDSSHTSVALACILHIVASQLSAQRCSKCSPGISDTQDTTVCPEGGYGCGVLQSLYMDVVEYSRNSVTPHAMCSHESYCELCSQCWSSVGCEARYTDAGPGRPYLRTCGCESEGLSVASGPVIRRWARHAISKLDKN
jgi:hypothetical protein